MGKQIHKIEGGSGGKRGHSNMCHWAHTEDIKKGSKRQRRINDKKIIREAIRACG